MAEGARWPRPRVTNRTNLAGLRRRVEACKAAGRACILPPAAHAPLAAILDGEGAIGPYLARLAEEVDWPVVRGIPLPPLPSDPLPDHLAHMRDDPDTRRTAWTLTAPLSWTEQRAHDYLAAVLTGLHEDGLLDDDPALPGAPGAPGAAPAERVN